MKHIVERIKQTIGDTSGIETVLVHPLIVKLVGGRGPFEIEEGTHLDMFSIQAGGKTYSIDWKFSDILPADMIKSAHELGRAYCQTLAESELDTVEYLALRTTAQILIPEALPGMLRMCMCDLLCPHLDTPTMLTQINSKCGTQGIWLFRHKTASRPAEGHVARFYSCLPSGHFEDSPEHITLLKFGIHFGYEIMYKESYRPGNKGLWIPALDAMKIMYNLYAIEALAETRRQIESERTV